MSADPGDSQALIRVLSAQVPADEVSGEVRIGGVPVTALDVDARRQRLVVAPHRADLLEGTLRSNVDPWERHHEARLHEVLTASAADDVTALRSGGLDAEVTAEGTTHSGGQRQRLALARALASEAPVLVLHDPTTAVDAVTEQRIADGIREVRDGPSRPGCSTSSPALLAAADRVVVVRDGRVVAEGSHARAGGRRRLPGGGAAMSRRILRRSRRPARRGALRVACSAATRARWSASGLAFCVVGLAGLVAPLAAGPDRRRGAGRRRGLDHRVVAVAIAVAAAVVGAVGIAAEGTAGPRSPSPPWPSCARTSSTGRCTSTPARGGGGRGDLVSPGRRRRPHHRPVARPTVVPTMIASAVAVVFTAVGLFALDWRLGPRRPGRGAVLRARRCAGTSPAPAPYYRRERGAQRRARRGAARPACTAPDPARVPAGAVTSSAGSATPRGRRRGSPSTCSRCSPASSAATTGPSCLGLLAILVTGFLLVRDDAATGRRGDRGGALLPPALQPGRRARGALRRGPVGRRLADPAGRRRRPDRRGPRTGRASRPDAGRSRSSGLTHEYDAGVAVVRRRRPRRPARRTGRAGRLDRRRQDDARRRSRPGCHPDPRPGPARGPGVPGSAGLAPRRHVALVSQEVHVFAGTVRDDLTPGRARRRPTRRSRRRCAPSAPGLGARASRRARHAWSATAPTS